MPVIALGGRSFAGPYMAPLWTPPRSAGVYAVLAPGWRLLTFRALDFGAAADFSQAGLLRRHPKHAEWLRIVGTEWNLYIALLGLPSSTPAQRDALLRELARDYRPEFKPLAQPQG